MPPDGSPNPSNWSSPPPSEDQFWNSPPAYAPSLPPGESLPPRREPSPQRRGMVSRAFVISLALIVALLGIEAVRYLQARHAPPITRDNNPSDRPY